MAKHRLIGVSVLAASLAASAGTALAHTGVTATSGLSYGLAHPVGGLDHVLAMVAVGMIGAVIGGRMMWLVPASFVAAMLAGGGLGMSGVGMPLVETAILLSVVVLGVALTLSRPLPAMVACALAAGFGLFHGHAHGSEIAAGISGVAYGVGFASATALMHAAGALTALGATRVFEQQGRVALRAGGAAMAAAGLALFVA